MAAHKYWRIKINANNGGSYTSIQEIEFRVAIDGVDQCSGGTATASSEVNGGNAALYAFDNNVSTKWTSASGDTTGWIQYEFATALDIVDVQLTCAYSGQSDYAPKDFDVEYSDDGVNYTVAASFTGETAWGDSENRTFALIDIDIWRLAISANNGGLFTSIQELDFKVSGSSLTDGLIGLASSQFDNSSNAVDNVFDNDLNTKWTSTSEGAVPSWVQVRLAAGTAVDELDITCAYSGQSSYAPKDFTIEKSADNGATFEVIKAVTGEAAWGTSETRSFSILVIAEASIYSTWDIEDSRVSVSIASSWDINQRVERTVSSIWDITALVGVSISALWDIKPPSIVRSVSATWDIIGIVGRSVSAPWNGAVVQRSVSCPYSIIAPVDRAVLSSWDITSQVSRSVQCRYDILDHNLASRSVKSTWSILEIKSPLIFANDFSFTRL